MANSDRCPSCGHKRDASVNSSRAYLLRRLRTRDGVTLKALVDDGIESGLDKSALLDAVRTAESLGDITIDKDWRLRNAC